MLTLRLRTAARKDLRTLELWDEVSCALGLKSSAASSQRERQREGPWGPVASSWAGRTHLAELVDFLGQLSQLGLALASGVGPVGRLGNAVRWSHCSFNAVQ